MWAARNSHTAIVNALILAGADPNPQNQVSARGNVQHGGLRSRANFLQPEDDVWRPELGLSGQFMYH
jgi:ankyrin repeat protein